MYDNPVLIGFQVSHLVIYGAFAIFTALACWIAISLRQVVPTNEVHIVQSTKKQTSYGSDTTNGNTYYKWPSWIPIIGISTTVMPVSVFKLELESYDAYDIGRVPFEVDIVAFFRIGDPNIAAQRVASFDELCQQLLFVMRGALRNILASEDIDRIMVERSALGEMFTKAVDEQLKNWGVHSVKNIELMDIRDTQGNQVIHNIMEKKKSLIEKESRVVVAGNMKDAKIAEIAANRDAMLEEQLAAESVGFRTAEKNAKVGIANERTLQQINDEQKTTKVKAMEVISVQAVRQAEITRQTQVIGAEQEKQVTILNAEGSLEAEKRKAEAIQVNGEARASAEKALLLAPVEAQTTLAKEIGENEGYQKYLVSVRQIEANQAVGVKQAEALAKADIKVIANAGAPSAGVTNVMDLFTPKGGTQLAGFVEALAQSPEGQSVIQKFVGPKGGKAA